MRTDNRKCARYNSIGRIDAAEICLFPGMLLDISQCGCRGHFPNALNFDEENEYVLKIHPMHKKSGAAFLLIGKPVWQRRENSATVVGFEFLHSPDRKRLDAYINQLELEALSMEDSAIGEPAHALAGAG
jgi:c-di-GMP-binding flagellar brake protein YcgR